MALPCPTALLVKPVKIVSTRHLCHIFAYFVAFSIKQAVKVQRDHTPTCMRHSFVGNGRHSEMSLSCKQE